MTDLEVLNLAISLSSKSVAGFARGVLARDPRNIRRWRAGGNIPRAARDFLLRYIGEDRLTAAEQASLVRPDTYLGSMPMRRVSQS